MKNKKKEDGKSILEGKVSLMLQKENDRLGKEIEKNLEIMRMVNEVNSKKQKGKK